MSRAASTAVELRSAVVAAIESRTGATVVDLVSRPSPYASSAPLEEVDARLADGRVLPLMFKDLSPGQASERALRVRPAFVRDPGRAIEAHRTIVPEGPAGPPEFYGGLEDPERERSWLLLERVDGFRLQHVGEFPAWESAARWLATFHARSAGLTEPPPRTRRLLRYTPELCRLWMDRAWAFLGAADGVLQPDQRAELARVAARYDRLIERFLALPSGILHGEYYAENVLVGRSPEDHRVCPLDWEMAGWGPFALDLAALVAGGWSEAEKARLAEAYRAAWPPGGAWPGEAPQLRDAVLLARFYLAVQWLGWFGRRQAPAWQAQDWLGEAVRTLEILDP